MKDRIDENPIENEPEPNTTFCDYCFQDRPNSGMLETESGYNMCASCEFTFYGEEGYSPNM